MKIPQFALFFHYIYSNNDFPQVFFSIESYVLDKIIKFYELTTEQFSADSIIFNPPSKIAIMSYIIKFLNQCDKKIILAEKNEGDYANSTIEEVLESKKFQEIKPSVYLCNDKKILLVKLKSLNVRLIKFCLKVYYATHFIVFWIIDGENDLFKLLIHRTLLTKLKNCKIVKNNPSFKVWKKVLKIDV